MRRSDEWQTLDVLMRDRDLGVRDAALEAALRVRVPDALVHLRAYCEDDDTRTVDSLRLLACVGGQSDAIVLRGSVEVSPLGEASLSGLGTLGYAACATHLVELMEYPSWARGAAAAFERITGLACTPRHVGPLSLQEEEDTFEDLRPVPDASAVRRMWENRLASFDRGTRCRRGQPLRAETWVADSSHGSLLTRREELFRLWATSPTQCRDVVLDAPAGRQRAASLEGSKP